LGKGGHADAEQPLKPGLEKAANADWANPAAIKAAFGMPASSATTAWFFL